jgi:hypothetical protein
VTTAEQSRGVRVEVEGMVAYSDAKEGKKKGAKTGHARGFRLVTLQGETITRRWDYARNIPIAWRYPDDDPTKRPITVTYDGETFQTNEVEWL